jgi:hypothetical protein
MKRLQSRTYCEFKKKLTFKYKGASVGIVIGDGFNLRQSFNFESKFWLLFIFL